MSTRNTNLALLVLTVSAVLSGFAAFTVGTTSGRWVVVAHGLIGLGILVLAPWKTMIARRGMARQGRSRWVSIALSVAAVVTIASGIVLITGLAGRLGPFTMMQAHVGAGVFTVVLTIAHSILRPVRPKSADLTKRNAIRSAGLLGVAGLMYVTTESVLAATGTPGSERRFTGSHAIGLGEPVPPTQWLNDRIQRLDGDRHHVRVGDMSYTIADIDAHGDVVQATLDCTGGWHATRHWSGTRLDRLLETMTGESLIVSSVTGYWRRFPRAQATRLWLVTRVEGDPLPDGNGGPVRLVAPDRRGFWWVKWVAKIEVDDLPPWWQPPLPMA